jgi:hypothetical protein
MDKVQKRGFIKYNTPSSEPFRIEGQGIVFGCEILAKNFAQRRRVL